MKRFYKVAITKEPVGSAIRHKEPAVKGKVIIKVTDSTTAGDFKLFVSDCDDDQNRANLAITGIEEISEKEAKKLAAQYQPERTSTRFNPMTIKEEEVKIPACNLENFLTNHI